MLYTVSAKNIDHKLPNSREKPRPGSHMSPEKFSTLIFSTKKFATTAGNLKNYRESHGCITCGICHLKINITRVDFFVKWSLPSVSPGLVKIPIFGSFILINKTFYFHLAFIRRSISAKRVVKFSRNFVPNYSRIFAFKTSRPTTKQALVAFHGSICHMLLAFFSPRCLLPKSLNLMLLG